MSEVAPELFLTRSETYFPMLSWVIPRSTDIPRCGTSANLIVLLGPAKIASERSLPTFFLSTSKAATNSMSPIP